MGESEEAAAKISLKDQGNEFFKAGNYLKAAALYTQAIKQDASNPTLYSTRAGTKTTMEDLLIDFIALDPPKFYGTGSPEEAESWLLSMDQEFEALECSDDDSKLKLAVFQLNEAAYYWWEGAKRALESQYGTLSWDRFKAAFQQNYFPSLKRDKAREFWNLKQENMSVEEYSRKFSSLLMYVPYIASDNEEKIQHFLGGLRSDIRLRVEIGLRRANSFEDVLDTAYLVEGSLERLDQAESSDCPNKSCFPVG